MRGWPRGAPRVRGFRARADGSIVPLAALAMTVLLGFAGVGIDVGAVYLEKRHVQSAADLAAMAAIRSIADPAAAQRTLTNNGYPNAGTLTVTPGVYKPDRTLAPGARFTAGGAVANAVRVTLSSTVRANFSRIVGGPPSYTVSGQATALRADLAAFGIGSRLASLDAGILNGLLSAMLGTKLSLSLMSYQALANLNVDALAFLRVVALRGNLQALTFNDVLKSSLSPADLTSALGGMAGASPGGSQAAAALSALTANLSGMSGRIPLGGLLTVGDLGTQPLATAGDLLAVNVLGLVTGAAALANGTNQASVDLGGTLPGLLKARVTLRVGQGWQTSGFVAPGASLSTAQTRALIEAWIPGPAGIASLYLPIYAELGGARATVRQVTCPWSARSDRAVSLDVTTGAAFLAVGSPAAGGLDPSTARPSLSPAPIVQVPVLTITGTGSLPIATGSQTLVFSDADIRAGRYKTVSASSLSGSPTAALLANLQVGGPQVLLAAIAGALSQATAPIDSLLFSVMGSFGLRIGSADVTVTGTHCGGAVLVQ